jgi:chromosome segregation ATPase
LAVFVIAGCSTTQRESRRIVSIKPDAAPVSASVADTRKSVSSASTRITSAKTATDEAILAASRNDIAFMSQKLAYISLTLQTTQEDLTEALSNVAKSESSIIALNAQIEQQTVELLSVNADYNALVDEKRKVELSLAAGKTREGILWKFLIGISIIALVEAAGLYLAFKPKFL